MTDKYEEGWREKCERLEAELVERVGRAIEARQALKGQP